LRSQPKLEPVYRLPDPPELSISQLIKYHEINSFSYKEGIVLYDPQADQWKLFRFLDQYEDLGRIIDIKKINEQFIISLEKGGVIISGSIVKTFYSTILASFKLKNKLLILSGEIHPEESANPYFYELFYSNADRLIIYDPKKDETEEIQLPETIYSIKYCELFKDHLWVYTFDEESEDWFPELLNIDLKGNVTTIESPDSNFNLIHSMLTYQDDLFIVRDSSLVAYSENHTMNKIMDIDPLEWNNLVRSYESGFYIFRSRSGDGYDDITGYTQIDLASKISKEISLPASLFSREKIYNDCLIFQGKLFKYCDYYQLVQGLELSVPEDRKVYTIRDGITDRIGNLTEDEQETWFLNDYSGIHRYIKSDSTWKSYTQFIDYLQDSTGALNCDVITINKDFVFIPLMSEHGGIVSYLLFDRKKEKFLVLSKEEFIRKFLFNGQKFVSYTGENLTEANPPNILEHIISYGDVWNLFLFLYELPISGNFSYDYGNLIISNNYCSILSFCVTPPKMFYDGILIKIKNDSTLYFMVADKLIRDFDATMHPYIIGGDAYRVFAASRGNFTHGLLIYDLPTNSCKTDKNLYEKLEDFIFIQGTGKYVMIGSYYNSRRLYAADVQTFELTDLTKYINGTPRNCKSTANFIYVATDEGLVYFDHNLNYQGKLNSSQTKLSRTKLNLYLIAENNVYLINDNDR
jgi:hypothetical protein